MKLNIGKLLAQAAKKAAPYVVPIVIAVGTRKLEKLGDKLVTKVGR